MEKFIGTKVIKANPEPISHVDHYDKYNWLWPEGKQEANRMGYTVGYPDAAGNFNGPLEGDCDYISWSPADVFESAYRTMAGMSFGQAIEAAKLGHKITRTGWNGKGMFLVYRNGYFDDTICEKSGSLSINKDEGARVRPYLQLRCVDGSPQMWIAIQSDILEEDWEIVE